MKGEVFMERSLSENFKAVADELKIKISMIKNSSMKESHKYAVNKYGSFSEYYCFLRNSYNLNNSDIIKRGDIERSYYYQIVKGNRKPSRDKVIRVCLGANLDPDEASLLLMASDYSPLYDFRIRDLIIKTALIKKFDVVGTNMLLDEFDVEPLK